MSHLACYIVWTELLSPMPNFQMQHIYLGKDPFEVRYVDPLWIGCIEQMVLKQEAKNLGGPVQKPDKAAQ